MHRGSVVWEVGLGVGLEIGCFLPRSARLFNPFVHTATLGLGGIGTYARIRAWRGDGFIYGVMFLGG